LEPALPFSLTFPIPLGGFEIGGWGSYCFTSNEAAEADIYVSYGFDFGLSIGVTDYYFPGTEYFDYTPNPVPMHLKSIWDMRSKVSPIAGNYILNEAGSAGSAGSDMYFERAMDSKFFQPFRGAGDGWHSADGEFALCNIGISASKRVQTLREAFPYPSAER
jgi:hypothetical protein